MDQKKLKLMIMPLLLVAGLTFFAPQKPAEAFTNQVIQQGSVGEDVIELQARLQYIGFYNGDIDGVFGWQTYWATRNFQYEFGIKVDGYVGEKTKQALERATEYDQSYVQEQRNQGKDFTHYGGQDNNQEQQATGQESEAPAPTAVNVPKGFSQNDIRLMAQAVYGEARGEPYEGQVAVAAVILNRIESSTFPDTISGWFLNHLHLQQSQMDKFTWSRMKQQKKLSWTPLMVGIPLVERPIISIRIQQLRTGFGEDLKLNGLGNTFFVIKTEV